MLKFVKIKLWGYFLDNRFPTHQHNGSDKLFLVQIACARGSSAENVIVGIDLSGQ